MFEDIRVYIMQRIWHMSKKASACDDIITPSIRNHLEVLKDKQRKWTVFPSGYQVVEVRTRDEAYGVNLITRECGCRLWNLSGVPCIHAVATFMHFKLNPDIRVSTWYSQSKWFDTYQFSIKPVYRSKMWKSTINTPPLLPIVKTVPGRPRKNRIKHPSELDDQHHVSRVGRVMTCQKCWRPCHNKSSCTNPRRDKPYETDILPRPQKSYVYTTSKNKRGGISINDVFKTQKEVGESSKRGGGLFSRGRGTASKRGSARGSGTMGRVLLGVLEQ
ncbi:zinc finger, PMZ-type containing protein [Tanacetum coccineum]